MMVWDSGTTTASAYDYNNSGWRSIVIHNNFPRCRNLRYLSELNPRRWTPNIHEAKVFYEKDLAQVKKIIEEIHKDFEKADWKFK